MYIYRIWQLPAKNERCFVQCDYNEIDLSEYVHVYMFKKHEKVNLEDVFRDLNIDHPADYFARSLSMSDVISVQEEDSNEREYWVVDRFGFKEVKPKER